MPRMVVLVPDQAHADGASLLSCKIKAAPIRGGPSPGDKVAMPGARCILDHIVAADQMIKTGGAPQRYTASDSFHS